MSLSLQNEKALKLLLTVPQKWRLFWASESIGISFALALVAIIYVEDSSPQMEGSDGPHPYGFTTWFVFWFNPASVTLVALLLSSTLQGLCDLWDEARERVEEPTFRLVVGSTCGAIVAALKRGKERLRQEPCFYGTLGVWLAQVVPHLFNVTGVGGVETAVQFVEDTPTSVEGSFEITSHKHNWICLTAVLTSGLALKAITLVARRYSASRCSLEGGEPIDRWTDGKVSRVPNLLIGWGIGYWVLSLLFVLGCSLHGGGWNNAPGIVTFLAYIIVPGFLISGAFMVADINFLGKRFGAFFKPSGDILNDRYRVEYWVMVTVFRDFIVVWILNCRVMGSMLSYW